MAASREALNFSIVARLSESSPESRMHSCCAVLLPAESISACARASRSSTATASLPASAVFNAFSSPEIRDSPASIFFASLADSVCAFEI